MSTIENWTDDYGGADTNTPQANTAIPFPANTTTDLGEILRDMKAVIRQESLNKGWEPDDLNAVGLSNTTFRISGDVTALHPAGTALQLDGATTLYTFAKSLSFSGGNTTVTITGGTVPASLDTARFSALKPASTPKKVADGYPADAGSCFPYRITQWGRFTVEDTAANATVYLARVEVNTSYRLLLQSVDVTSGPADNNAYVVTDIAKSTDLFVVTFQAAPGSGALLYWDYAVVRGT